MVKIFEISSKTLETNFFLIQTQENLRRIFYYGSFRKKSAEKNLKHANAIFQFNS